MATLESSSSSDRISLPELHQSPRRQRGDTPTFGIAAKLPSVQALGGVNMLTIRNVFALLVVCVVARPARAQDQVTGSGVPIRQGAARKRSE
jgi:hypothetical protein